MKRFIEATALTVGAVTALSGASPELMPAQEFAPDGRALIDVEAFANAEPLAPPAITRAAQAAVAIRVWHPRLAVQEADSDTVQTHEQGYNAGSGAIIAIGDQRAIMTAEHVTDDAQGHCGEITVQMTDEHGDGHSSKVIGRSQPRDIKVQDIALVDLGKLRAMDSKPALPVAEPSSVQRGEAVYSIGYQPAEIGGYEVARSPIAFEPALREPVILPGLLLGKTLQGDMAVLHDRAGTSYDPVSGQTTVIGGQSGSAYVNAEGAVIANTQSVTLDDKPQSQIERDFDVHINDGDGNPDTPYSVAFGQPITPGLARTMLAETVASPVCDTAPAIAMTEQEYLDFEQHRRK